MAREIKICMGSACHIKGAPNLVQAFQDEINKRGLTNDIELKGCFCTKNCLEGVNVTVNNVLYIHCTVDDVAHYVDLAMGVDQ